METFFNILWWTAALIINGLAFYWGYKQCFKPNKYNVCKKCGNNKFSTQEYL